VAVRVRISQAVAFTLEFVSRITIGVRQLHAR
jgi:hypothetical protein